MKKGKRREIKAPKQLYVAAAQKNIDNVNQLEHIWLQVGMTTKGKEVFKQTRYAPTKQQAGEIKSLKWFDLGEYQDHDVHSKLKARGFFPDPKNRELFRFPSVKEGLEIIAECLNEVKRGIARKDSYKMRPEQIECCDKVVTHFLNNEIAFAPFLIAAKTRFGKTFVTYQIVREWQKHIKHGLKILIISCKPDVSEAWKDDAANHCDFDGFLYTRAKDEKPKNRRNKPLIVFESLQQLYNITGKKKSEWIYGENWDLVVIDEEHYGTKTENAEAIKKKLNYKQELALSGTPFKSLLMGKYGEDNIYSWTLTDEQKKRNLEKDLGWKTEVYRSLPEMHFHLFKIAPDVIKKAKEHGYVGEDGFTIDKVFAAQNGKFENPELVKLFLDSLADRRKDGSWSPWHSKELQNKETLLEHTLWIMPWSVDSVKAMTEMMKNHWFFKNFHILCASGQGKEATTRIHEVKEAIKRYPKTITLSCGRFDTGTTVPEWGAVLMMDGGNSPEKYFQSIGRCGSEWVDRDPTTGNITKYRKENCLVIDYNPLRSLKCLYQWNEILTKPGCDTEDGVKDFLDVASIMEHGENGVVKVDLDDILSVFTLNERHLRNFTTAKSYVLGNLNAEMIAKLNKISINKARSIEMAFNLNSELEDESAKTKKGKKKPSKREKDIITEQEKLRERIRTIFSRLPTYLFIRKGEEKSISEICSKGDSELFREVTGFELSDFKRCVDERIFDEKYINRQVLEYSRSVRAIKPGNYEHVIELLEKFERMGKEETPGTSGRLVREMLDLREDSWDNPNTKYVDLACSTGTFLIEVVMRLDKGLSGLIPDRQQRLRRIIEKMVHGYESNEVPYLMTKAAFQILFGDIDVEPNLVLGDPLKFSKRKQKEMKKKFDDCVVVMNPPYQQNDGGGKGASATPLFDKFVNLAKELSPNCIVAITPSKWFVGGKGLNKYRKEMLNDKRIKKLIDYPNAVECFPGVEIKGGVSYFLWDKSYSGDCEITTIKNGKKGSSMKRSLCQYDILVRFNEAIPILKKISNHVKTTMSKQVKACQPFGLPTNFKNYKKKSDKSSITLYGNKFIGYIHRDQVMKNHSWVTKYKVLIPRASDGSGNFPIQVLGTPFVVSPDSACTLTYLVCGLYDTQKEAENLVTYLKTKLVRFLVSMIKTTQICSRGKFEFVPILDMKTAWTDKMLYKRYGLDDSEIAFIEKMIKEMK